MKRNENVHCRIIHNNQDVATTQCPWWDKKMWHTHTTEYYSVRKKGDPITCNSINGSGRHYATLNKSVTDEQILHGTIYVR